MKFSLVNLGCKVNRVESDSIGAALLASGWESVDQGADVAILNTCTVTAEADRKTRKEVNRAVTRNPEAVVLVTGCAATMDPDAYTALSDHVRVVEKGSVVDTCFALVGQTYEHAPTLLRVGDEFPTRVGVKVQDGCDNACTYCIVHVARGKAVSLPLEQVVEEVQRYAHAGVREIVLTGIDLGAYSCEGVGLAQLIEKLRAAAPETRLRISSIEPVSIDDGLIELLAREDGMVCRHLHIPLQSGSTKVLHEMARRYTAEDYRALIKKLRRSVPELSLSTDVIVGFPGETDDDFEQTCEMARVCGFSRMHVFRYSQREGTPAAERSDQVPSNVKTARSNELMRIAEILRTQDAMTRIGSQERVLVESSGQGMTESYYPVTMPSNARVGSMDLYTLKAWEKDGRFSV